MKFTELNDKELIAISGGNSLLPFPYNPADVTFYDDVPRPLPLIP